MSLSYVKLVFGLFRMFPTLLTPHYNRSPVQPDTAIVKRVLGVEGETLFFSFVEFAGYSC